VDGLVNGLVDPVMDASRELADAADDLMLDCRGLDAEDNLPEQIMLLVLDKIEDQLRDHFGSTKPRINVGVNFGFRDFLGNYHSIYFSLGRIEMNLNPFLNLVRETIEDLDFYHDVLNRTGTALANALAKELEIAADLLRQSETQEVKQRLDKISAEHNNAPKEIVILNPTTLSHHTRTINFKIHLGGVPLSFLGLGQDESQRVLIYLNAELIPVKSLVVEESTRIGNLKKHVADFDLATSKAFNSKSAVLTNGVASIMIDTARHYPTQAIKQQPRNQAQYGLGPLVYRDLAAAKSVSAAAGKRNTGKSRFIDVKVNNDRKGRTVNQYDIKNGLPGRGNAPSRDDELMQATMPGIMLQFKLQLDELTEGVNVLTVAVIEKGGNRHQQNVSFTVSKPQRKMRGRTLPGVPVGEVPKGGKLPKKSIRVELEQRQGAGGGKKTMNTLMPINSAQLKQQQQQALRYLRAQNKLNFKAMEKPPLGR
jgi:hypothetical protein